MDRYKIVSREEALEMDLYSGWLEGTELPGDGNTERFILEVEDHEQDGVTPIGIFPLMIDLLLSELNDVSSQLDAVVEEREKLESLQIIYETMNKGKRRSNKFDDDDDWG